MRSFTVHYVRKPAQECATYSGSKGGRYMSTTPSGAARKAFTRRCRSKKVRGRCTLVIAVKETTRGSEHKIHAYKMSRVLLDEPVIRAIGDKVITNRYGIKMKAVELSKQGRKKCQ